MLRKRINICIEYRCWLWNQMWIYQNHSEWCNESFHRKFLNINESCVYIVLFCSIRVIRIPSVVFAEHRNCLVTQSGSSHTQAAACTPGAECREEGRVFESFWAILKGDGNPKLSDSGKYNHLTRITADLWLGIYSSRPVICLICVLFSPNCWETMQLTSYTFVVATIGVLLSHHLGLPGKAKFKMRRLKKNINHSSAQKSLKHPGKKRLTSQPLCKKGTFGGIFPLWPYCKQVNM